MSYVFCELYDIVNNGIDKYLTLSSKSPASILQRNKRWSNVKKKGREFMDKGIGETITKLRMKAGYTQKQLSNGICSRTDITRIECDQSPPDPFLLDRMFGRLGKSAERLEYILPLELYEIYELRYFIQTALCHLQLEEAEMLLTKYEKIKQADTPLHRQFIEQERAQAAWIRGENAEQILALLNRAIGRTMSLENQLCGDTALSAEELKLLLFRWEICKGTVYERNAAELKEILDYAEKHCTDHDAKVSVYPYAVLLLNDECDMETSGSYLMEMLSAALELLRESGKILYLPEIIARYAAAAEYTHTATEETEKLKSAGKTLLALEHQFHIHFEKYRLFQHITREFELDYEVLQRNRMAAGMTQEELCEGICTRETLSRIESGKRKPNSKKMELLLDRMNREGNRIDTVITTEEFELIELKRELEKSMQRFDQDKAEYLFQELERKLDMTILKNKQYILKMRIKQEYNRGVLLGEECLEQLYDLLKMTLPEEDLDKILEYRLTSTENNLVNMIAICYYYENNKEKAIEIYKKMLANYEQSRVNPVFHIREWELQMSNLATNLEETGRLEETEEVFRRKTKLALEAGKGNNIGSTLGTVACVAEQRRDKINGKIYFTQALDMQYLMKMEKSYTVIKEYMENPEFFLNDTNI